MLLESILGLLVAAPFTSGAPVSAPAGVADATPAQIAEFQHRAGGTLPNGPLPPQLDAETITTLQLIALNEIFEVSFFNDLLHNITENVPGYDLHDIGVERELVINTIDNILNQEKLHYIGVNAALKNVGAQTITPCQYEFPVATFHDAITLAQTFTDVVLATLPLAQTTFAGNANSLGLIALFGSVIGQEGEQNGFFRVAQGDKLPSAAPFLTAGAPPFAFTALQSFIVPGSCPENIALLSQNIPTFEALDVSTKPVTEDTATLEFEVPASSQVSAESNAIAYLSGQNLPVTVPISNVRAGGDGKTHFEAEFPFKSAGFARGLTIAALVKGKGPFTTNKEVADVTINGPGLIEVN